MLCKTEWSWELRTWSHKMNLLDILSTSPHYFSRKWIGATNENSNYDLRVWRVNRPFHGYFYPFNALQKFDWLFLCFLFKFDEGITFAKKVVAMGDEKELSSRGYLALGIGYSLQSCEGRFLVRLFTHGLQASSEFENRETRRVVREQREKPWSFAAQSRGVTFADSWQLVSYIITNFLDRNNFLPKFLYLSFVIHVSLFYYRLFIFLFTS